MRAWPILVVALALSILIAACAGHDWATPADLFRAIAGATDLRSRLLVEWRVPRVLAAALVGALLGLGGTVFQGVFRNPLAEPYLLGSAGGAALGATVALLVPLAAPQSFVLPVLAFAGAWGATMLVIGISRVSGAVDAAGMLLAGVAVAAILGALRSFLMLALSDETVSLQIVLSWVLGGVQTPSWPILGLLAAISVACLILTMLLHDVGKGMAVNNHVTGSLNALERAAKRLELSPEEKAEVHFLIEHHLDMSATMQRVFPSCRHSQLLPAWPRRLRQARRAASRLEASPACRSLPRHARKVPSACPTSRIPLDWKRFQS